MIKTSVNFHRIWFGDKKIPDSYEKFWNAWQRQFPWCNFRTWTDEDIDSLEISKSSIIAADGYARKADIARYEIMYKYGGIYLDCDIQPYNYFDPETLTSQLTICNEDRNTIYCSIGFLAGPSNLPIFKELLDYITNIKLNLHPPNIETGPHLFGKFLQNHSFLRLETDAFYPYLYNQPYSSILHKNLSGTVGIHVWAGSWLNENQKLEKNEILIKYGDIEFLAHEKYYDNNFDTPSNSLQLSEVTKIAEIRKLIIKSWETGNFSRFLNFNISDNCLDLLKTTFYLLKNDKDAVVWQFGAADGILVDPIRPALINFDPCTVLLEPNPYMHESLIKNYASNKNLKFLKSAYSSTPNNILINCINPQLVEDNNLPNWVIGLSSAYDDRNAIGGLTIDEETRVKISKCIEVKSVSSISVEKILKIYNNKDPDIVIIDIEGMDFEVIFDILEKGIKPKIIQIEIQCLPEQEKEQLINLFKEDYLIVPKGNDWIAYRSDFILEYYTHLFIYNGIPGPFKNLVSHLLNFNN